MGEDSNQYLSSVLDKLKTKKFGSMDADQLASFLSQRRELSDPRYLEITGDDILRVRLLGLLLNKSENAPESGQTGVDGEEWRKIGEVFTKMKIILEDLESSRIIDNLTFFIGGGCIFTIVEKRAYKDSLYAIIKSMLSLTNLPRIEQETANMVAGNSNLELDMKFMQIALDEARLSKSEGVKPRPFVGAVLVKDGKIEARAHRGEISKGDHAEYTLLERRFPGVDLTGYTLYTTLEPCTVRDPSKTPCVQRIINRNIRRVVIGMLDPDIRIQGKGYYKLYQDGIDVVLLPLSIGKQVMALNEQFIKYCEKEVETQLPDRAKTLQLIKEELDINLKNIDETEKDFFNVPLVLIRDSYDLATKSGNIWLLSPRLRTSLSELYVKFTRVNILTPKTFDLASEGALIEQKARLLPLMVELKRNITDCNKLLELDFAVS